MKIATTATEALKMLWADKFFTEWKKWVDVVSSLDKKGYHFSDAELGMALKRAKFLTRKGSRTNYQYIQKHPFIGDDTNGAK